MDAAPTWCAGGRKVEFSGLVKVHYKSASLVQAPRMVSLEARASARHGKKVLG